MRARPFADVAFITLPPAAHAPMQALMAECSDSTVTRFVSTSPSATNVEYCCMTSVEGVIG